MKYNLILTLLLNFYFATAAFAGDSDTERNLTEERGYYDFYSEFIIKTPPQKIQQLEEPSSLNPLSEPEIDVLLAKYRNNQVAQRDVLVLSTEIVRKITDHKEIRLIYKKLKKLSIGLDIWFFNTILKNIIFESNLQDELILKKVKTYIREIKELRLELDSTTEDLVRSAYHNAGGHLSSALAERYLGFKTDNDVYNMALAEIRKAINLRNNPGAAEEILRELIREDLSVSYAFYDQVIQSYSSHGRIGDVRRLLDEMRCKNITLNQGFYDLLYSAYPKPKSLINYSLWQFHSGTLSYVDFMNNVRTLVQQAPSLADVQQVMDDLRDHLIPIEPELQELFEKAIGRETSLPNSVPQRPYY